LSLIAPSPFLFPQCGNPENASHEDNARKLVDALLKVETEEELVATMIGRIPTRPQIKITEPD